MDEFQMVLESSFPYNRFKLIFSPEFAAAVEICRDEDPFFTSSDNKTMAMRTQDWAVLTKNIPCDYVMYCKIARGKAKKKSNGFFLMNTRKVEMDCTLRVFNVAKGTYTYATKYRTVGKAHNTSNFERAERKAVMGAFQFMKFDPNAI